MTNAQIKSAMELAKRIQATSNHYLAEYKLAVALLHLAKEPEREWRVPGVEAGAIKSLQQAIKIRDFAKASHIESRTKAVPPGPWEPMKKEGNDG